LHSLGIARREDTGKKVQIIRCDKLNGTEREGKRRERGPKAWDEGRLPRPRGTAVLYGGGIYIQRKGKGENVKEAAVGKMESGLGAVS